jgi:hypothetical protein
MSEHPITSYLKDKIIASGLSEKNIVSKMGYKNLAKGLRRLHDVLNGDIENKTFLSGLSKVLAFPVDELVKIKSEYEYQLRKEAFRPHLFSETSRNIPQPIFVGAMCAHMRYIYLEEDFLELEYIDQLTRVSSHVTAHMLKYDGGIGGFGSIKYYILQKTFEEPKKDRLYFDTSGSLIANPAPEDKSEPGVATLTVKGRSILPILRMDSEQKI